LSLYNLAQGARELTRRRPGLPVANARADREPDPPAVRFPRFRGFQIDETPRKWPRLPLVQQQLRASSQWRQTASFLPPGVPQGLRCGWAPMGGRSNRCRHADRGCAQEWPCINARVGGGRYDGRAGKRGGSAASYARGAQRGGWRRASKGLREPLGPDDRDAAARLSKIDPNRMTF